VFIRDLMLCYIIEAEGSYTDNTGSKGSATYVYVVCEAGTSTCSDDSVVVF